MLKPNFDFYHNNQFTVKLLTVFGFLQKLRIDEDFVVVVPVFGKRRLIALIWTFIFLVPSISIGIYLAYDENTFVLIELIKNTFKVEY